MLADTRFLLENGLPALAEAGPEDAVEAFHTFHTQVEEAACRQGDPESRFDWSEAYRIIDYNADRLHLPDRSRIAVVAARTAILYGGEEVALHEPEGTFLAVNTGGLAIAGMNWPSPNVPKEYGHPDYYALIKLGGAITVERLVRQGADWGDGYKQWAKLIGRQAPTIGMATYHTVPYGTVPKGTDRQARGYVGTTHRVIARSMDDIIDADPRLTHLPRPVCVNDFLAGLLDSMSGTGALKALFGRTLRPWVVELPNLIGDPDYVDVNLN